MASQTSESRVRSTSRDGEQHPPSRDLGRWHLVCISPASRDRGEMASRQHLVIVRIVAAYGERGRPAHSA